MAIQSNGSESYSEVWQQSELPREISGELNWSVLGKMLTASVLAEVLKGSYADLKNGHGCLHADPTTCTDWKYVDEQHDVLIFEKKSKNIPGLKSFLGRGVIDLPLRKIADILHDSAHTAFIWDKFLVDAGYVKLISESDSHRDYIGYNLLAAQRCCCYKIQRDVCCFTRGIFLDDGKYVLTMASVEHPECPCVPGIVRMKCHAGTGWVLERYRGSNHRTLVSIVGNVDPAGVPRVILKKALKSYPLSIHYLREHLTQQMHWDKSTSSEFDSRTSTSIQANAVYSSSSSSSDIELSSKKERVHLTVEHAKTTVYGSSCGPLSSSTSSNASEDQPLL